MPAKLQKPRLWISVILATIAISTGYVAASIVQGYSTNDPDLQLGMAASLSEETEDEPLVERASRSNIQKVIGIVTTLDQSLVAISSSDEKVYVQSIGEVTAYVTDTNGPIREGDLLTLSTVQGLLAKSDTSQYGFATALENMDFETADEYAVSSPAGERVKIASLRVSINNQALFTAENENGGNDSALTALGRSVTGREVSEIRIVIALTIFILIMIFEGGIIYGAVSGAITALGRNPLARKFIVQEQTRVTAVAFAVLLIGLGSIYVILWI